jgi:hypothetical protein
MPVKTIHCRICGKAIKGYSFKIRMAKLRRHYKRNHPGAFSRMIKKSVETKKKRK